MKRDYVYIGILIVMISFFLFRECSNQKQTDQLVRNISLYSDTAKVEKLKNGILIYTNTSLKLQSEEQIRILASSLNDTIKQMVKRFKSVSNVTYVTNKFYASGDTIRYANIPCDFKPFKVRRGEDSTYKLVGTISKNYFSVDSLTIKDNIALIFGRKKVGFMKHDYAVDINHSNSMMKTTNIKDYKYIPEKKWYERTWVHMGIGGVIVVTAIESLKHLIR